MSAERGFKQAELVTVLRSGKFAQRITELAMYTETKKAEGGFCVYKNSETAKLSISPALLPTDKEREEERQLYNGGVLPNDYLGTFLANSSFGFARLIKRGYNYRRDVGLYIHSHPSGISALAPSVEDLAIYDTLNGYSRNVIAGILAVSGMQAQLYMYGQTTTRSATGRYQLYEESTMTAPAVRQMLADDGMATAVAEYDITPSAPRIVSYASSIAAEYFK